jgi:hypothetical protein
MSDDRTTRFKLPYLSESQDNAEVSHNEAIDRLDLLNGMLVKTRSLSSPPGITDGEVFIIGDSATGAWSGFDGELGMAINSSWTILDPANGLPFYVEDEDAPGIWINGPVFRQMSPRIALGKTANQTLSGGTETNVTWNSQIAIDRYYTHSTSSLTERINVPDVGLYEIECQLTIERTSGSGEHELALRVYGATTQLTRAESRISFDGTYHTVTIKVIASVSAAYIKVTAQRTAGAGDLRVNAAGSFLKISRA